MRILCLDVGEKNIGVAVSDPLGLTAQGVSVIRRSGLKKDLDSIRQLLDKYEIEKGIMGLPLNMNGTVGKKAKEVLDFKGFLEKNISVPVLTWDERLTTAAANRTLLEADVSRAKRKKVADKLAAVFILESYLRFESGKKD